MNTETITQAQLIDYWQAVEFFSPQRIPDLSHRSKQEAVFQASLHSPLNWEEHHPLKQRLLPPGMIYKHQVYCGLFQLEAMRLHLEKFFGSDNTSELQERSDGTACLFSFLVNHQGRPLLDSVVLSSCAFGIGQTITNNIDYGEWLNNFERVENKLAQELKTFCTLTSDDTEGQELHKLGHAVGRVLTFHDLETITQWLIKQLGLSPFIIQCDIRIKSTFVSPKKQYLAEELDFLNSFYLRDLKRVSKAIKKERYGNALKKFLSPTTEDEKKLRIDIRKANSAYLKYLSLTFLPKGKWPSKNHHALTFSQQFAVNACLGELKNHDDLFAINGPPGTGKTTLLREFVSALIVERAQQLAQFKKPSEIFIHTLTWTSGRYLRVIPVLDSTITGYEMIVSSNNNHAVENVSLELPGIQSIDTIWTESTSYFKNFADFLFNQECWGLISAKLGNKNNRQEFLNRFWFGHQEESKQQDLFGSKHLLGFNDFLKSCKKTDISFSQTVKKFKNLMTQEQQFRTQFSHLFESHELPKLLALPIEQREQLCPYANEYWNKLRAEIFLTALELHKACIIHNAEKIRDAFHGIYDILTGSLPKEATPQAIQAAWQIFFLVIPVISTTFASFDRLFTKVSHCKLGWLFIDEAAQAAPQAAVGALWRCKKAIIVGDPLQLEPVHTLSVPAQFALAHYFKVSQDWIPSFTSVQQLADQHHFIGTEIELFQEKKWVGCPLRLHKRCDLVMFNLSNLIAYDQLMVFGTEPREILNAPESAWFDIQSLDSDHHFIFAEGQFVQKALKKLILHGFKPQEIFIISPFRKVIREFWPLTRLYHGLNIGTIHSFQGKEANFVFLVLGSHPEAFGARKWASEKPNLLNVAASRAKRRFYIIGNFNLWSKMPYFNQAATILPRKIIH